MQVLILVDQPDLQQTLQAAARQLELQPTIVATVDEALQAYRAHHYELVITSWNSSHQNYQPLCRGIRELDTHHCTVILIAAGAQPSFDLQAALEAGADDYFIVLEPALLRLRLRIAVERARNRYSAYLVEQKLRESIERFELAVAGANDGLWDFVPHDWPWDHPKNEVWYSPRFRELIGFSEQEFPNVLGSWVARLHPDDREKTLAAVQDHILSRRPYDVDYRLLTKSGEYRWFSARGLGIWNSEGRMLRMSGSLRDITEVKNYETDLQQSESKWRSLVENAPDVIILADLDGKIKFINRSTALAEQSIGKYLYDYIEEPFKERTRDALEAIRATGQPQRFEVRGLSENGRDQVWYANRLGPIRQNDRIDSVILISTDITRRKEAEERVLREQQLLRRLLDLQEQERQITAYDIHDGLVQYLTGALMHLEAFAAANPPSPDKVQAEFERGLELLREAISDGRRLISGLRPPILDERGVAASLEYLVSEARPYIPEIEFVNQTHFGRLAAPLEAAIFRVAQAALSNIRQHSGARRALIELIQHDDSVRLTIRDWGHGFDPAKIRDDRFGLQGIRERARLLGASAQIESAHGQGTTISVDFPVIAENSSRSS